MGSVTLLGRGRRTLLEGQAWIYRGDLGKSDAGPGELVPVLDQEGDVLGWALHSTSSKLALRMVTRSPEQPNREFWARRVERCLEARAGAGFLDASQPMAACRLIGGDADGLPGLVVDRYGDRLVLQCGTEAADMMRDFLLELLLSGLTKRGIEIVGILDRSDAKVRDNENLDSRIEWLRGDASMEKLMVEEDGLTYAVDLGTGHKTGHYLDQRDNRRRAANLVQDLGKCGFREPKDARVLDVFSYDGLFGMLAAQAGAKQVLCLDQSASAGERVLQNAQINNVESQVSFEKVNAMHDLGRRVDRGEEWDIVILDPPAFARSKRELPGAKRGYGELFRRGFQLMPKGGFLVAASCSYNMKPEAFLGVLTKAARDAKVIAHLLDIHGASVDHPRRLDIPETDYLKCAFIRVEPKS
ncbi:MAG: 23S rRNA (cytosine1962-C5)-methyltransferase [Gammaproteobacteria bacterium]|jgi:23S rRNA (cytosine1962-C5)-methyltransferase